MEGTGGNGQLRQSPVTKAHDAMNVKRPVSIAIGSGAISVI